jgi:hypothetical protein
MNLTEVFTFKHSTHLGETDVYIPVCVNLSSFGENRLQARKSGQLELSSVTAKVLLRKSVCRELMYIQGVSRL